MELVLSPEKHHKITSGSRSASATVSLASGTKLILPPNAVGLVVFCMAAHSGTAADAVVAAFHKSNLGTLEFDCTDGLAMKQHDLQSSARRLYQITAEVSREQARGLPIGFFGTDVGAAISLVTAAEMGTKICAVVSCAGRLDLAALALPKLESPTLFLAAGRDIPSVDLNEQASRVVQCEKAVTVVPRANHLLEEPGALATVTRVSSEWFLKHF